MRLAAEKLSEELRDSLLQNTTQGVLEAETPHRTTVVHRRDSYPNLILNNNMLNALFSSNNLGLCHRTYHEL